MPRQRTDEYWTLKIHELAESLPRPSAKTIEKELEQIAEREGRAADYPSPRSIGRLLQDHRNLSERERAIYREFHWPHAMVNSFLPWDASRLALDVLREEWRQRGRRPSIQRVLWHWRVSLAIPGAGYEGRDPVVSQILYATDLPQSSDWPLAFEVWYGHDDGNKELAATFPDGYPEDITGGG